MAEVPVTPQEIAQAIGLVNQFNDIDAHIEENHGAGFAASFTQPAHDNVVVQLAGLVTNAMQQGNYTGWRNITTNNGHLQIVLTRPIVA